MPVIDSNLFWGTFSVVGKGRGNFPLRFRKRIYTTKVGTTIIIYYKEAREPNEDDQTIEEDLRPDPWS
jgi:hypothetical protein